MYDGINGGINSDFYLVSLEKLEDRSGYRTYIQLHVQAAWKHR